MQDVVDARYVLGHTVWVRFEDGTEGEIDLSEELYGPLFEPLAPLESFASFRLNRDTGTIEWPNGADFAPEFLYEKVSVTA